MSIIRFSTQSITWTNASSNEQVVIYDGVDTDITDWYNIETGRFSPKHSGYYQISAGARALNGSESRLAESSLVLRKNGTQISFSGGIGMVGGVVSRLVYLDGNTDYVDVVINSDATSGTTVQNSDNSYFTATRS